MTTSQSRSLYQRYMGAYADWQAHLARCTCTAQSPCSTGAPLFERLSRLQEAWTRHLRDGR
ncbi:hypothetical protein [Streptomyces sp. NPDC059491]|uniref:hypothetical protein n=1 Tax=Streptomyces sp. NPDC059491 TaxID=3346850 RepID=UPI0036B17BE5